MRINISGSGAEQGVVQQGALQALVAQYYSADQAGTDLKSAFEPDEIQYWNIGTLSSSTRDSSGKSSHFFLLFSSPFDFFWPLTSPYERHFGWMHKTWLISPLCFWSPATTIKEHKRRTIGGALNTNKQCITLLQAAKHDCINVCFCNSTSR